MLNDARREIPDKIEGYGTVRPYKRETGQITSGRNALKPAKNRTTLFTSCLEDAIIRSELKNGGRISFHHHLRLGDRVVSRVLKILEDMGYRDLIICLSSVMGPASEAVLHAVGKSVVRRIETTGLKSPLGESLLKGEIPEPVVFRSHGGRARAIDRGELPINVAFIAASAVDRQGNMTGAEGTNKFGSLGYAIVDARNADCVIGISDCISENPLSHISIPCTEVDFMVKVESIGDRKGISGGSIRISKRPIESLIAQKAVKALIASKIIKQDFSYQAGSGGISLLVSQYLREYMKEKGIEGSFASGGATGDLVKMLKEGLFSTLWDVQSFDADAAVSLKENDFHKEMCASRYASSDHIDCIAHKLDVMILSATEIDRDFHVNSITGTNGRIIGALGGAPDTAAGSALTMVVLPSFRGRIPTVNERVRTVCTPGSTVDMLITERGIAVNPQRDDLSHSLKTSGLEVLPIGDLIKNIYKLTGKPDLPEEGSDIAGVVEYRDGTVIDCIRY